MEKAMEQRCRIVREDDAAPDAITFSIRGKFDEEAVTAFQERVHSARNERMRIYVDVSEITLVDLDAARCLRTEQQAGVTFLNCPAYLRPWILNGSPTASRIEK
jgi:anti-anti-sigma regulatory factor